MRKACKKREEKIKKVIAKVLVALCFIVFSYGFAHADIKVYDSKGQFLGYGFLYGSPFGASFVNVYVPKVSRYITFGTLSGDPFEGGDSFSLWYKSFDCSGSPYVSAEGTYEIGKNGDRYYTGQNVAPALIAFNSFYNSGVCESAFFEYVAVPALDITQSMPFRIPVSLPFKFKQD